MHPCKVFNLNRPTHRWPSPPVPLAVYAKYQLLLHLSSPSLPAQGSGNSQPVVVGWYLKESIPVALPLLLLLLVRPPEATESSGGLLRWREREREREKGGEGGSPGPAAAGRTSRQVGGRSGHSRAVLRNLDGAVRQGSVD